MTIKEKLKSKEWQKFEKFLPPMEFDSRVYKKDTLKVLSLQEDFSKMTDEELKKYAQDLRNRAQKGEDLESLKYESFALMRETSKRVLGKEHYPVQILGGMALLDGNIAEMGTGEGKTLMALLPTFLHALTGENVHVITSNEYLAQRDCEMAQKVFGFLGMSCGVSLAGMSIKQKQEAYKKNVTYVTCSEVGFDYLRDNMCFDKEQRVLQGLNFAVIDEVDNVLLDEGSTPLVVSRDMMKTDKELIKKARAFVETLENEDVEIDIENNSIVLSESGMDKAQAFFDKPELYSDEDEDIDETTLYEINKMQDAILNALKAEVFFDRDDEYIVRDGKIEIVGAFIGRVMEGRQFSYGLHQALQAKEGVEITDEMMFGAQITIQNFFNLYKEKAGMTGTAKEDQIEFEDGFKMGVVRIPLNKERKRKDAEIEVYASEDAKYKALVADVVARHEKGQPVLIGVSSVEESEVVSELLKKAKLKHNVLNAKATVGVMATEEEQDKMLQEDFVVAQAGRKGAITVATNMAGRGTDILLGGNASYLAKEEMMKEGYTSEEVSLAETIYDTKDERILALRKHFSELENKHKKDTDKEKEEVKSAGGLCVIGTNLNKSRRIDNQLKGRAGRGGDQGETKIMCSLEDEILIENVESDKIDKLKERCKDQGVASLKKLPLKMLQRAQRQEEGRASNSRKWMRKFGKVADIQRKRFYDLRNETLESDDFSVQFGGMIKFIAKKNIAEEEERVKEENMKTVYEAREETITKVAKIYGIKIDNIEEIAHESDDKIAEIIAKKVVDENKDFINENKEEMKEFWLSGLDKTWADFLGRSNLATMTAGLSYMGSKDPVLDYQEESDKVLNMMINDTAQNFVYNNLFVYKNIGYYHTIREMKKIREQQEKQKEEEQRKQKEEKKVEISRDEIVKKRIRPKAKEIESDTEISEEKENAQEEQKKPEGKIQNKKEDVISESGIES